MPFTKGYTPWTKGRKLSKEHRRKIGLANKGKKTWCAGKKLPKSFGRKISRALKNKYSGKKSYHWNGGKFIQAGYVHVYAPNHPRAKKKYIAEHRLVIESQIGRFLESHEVVHHIGKKTDNRPHKLMAFKSHSAHRRFEVKKQVERHEIIFDGRELEPIPRK